MPRKLTQEEFIRRARSIYGWKFDYSKSKYSNIDTQIKIICPIHGEFMQTPYVHLRSKYGCPKCGHEQGAKKISDDTISFVEKSRSIHGNIYDYSETIYKSDREDIYVVCPKHGGFWQNASNHKQGAGCPKCSLERRANDRCLTEEDFILRARSIHGLKYDYSKVEYAKSHDKLCIICSEHGEFWQAAYQHLNGHGCPKCAKAIIGRCRLMSNEEFIRRCTKKHNGKYDYSRTRYVNAFAKVCVICPEHGEFWQVATTHLNGHGCPKCNPMAAKTTDKFVADAQRVHGVKYDYSEVEYLYSDKKVCIICPCHGRFWQEPGAHLNGQGCPKCKSSKLEMRALNKFKEMGVDAIKEKRFEWLKDKATMPLDFYLPGYNIAVECQGEQHFGLGPKFFNVEEVARHDALKLKLCQEHNLPLYYINYNENVEERVDEIINIVKQSIVTTT